MSKFENKLLKFLNKHNYSISKENLSLLSNKLHNSYLFKNYNQEFEYVQNAQNGGSVILPSEYFGINSSNFSNNSSSTNTSPNNTSIRPEITSDIFPLNGGGCPCMFGGMYKGCALFTNSDLQNFKNKNLINFNKNNLNQNKEFLNNKLSIGLHTLLSNVKNKDNLIGKSHINKL